MGNLATLAPRKVSVHSLGSLGHAHGLTVARNSFVSHVERSSCTSCAPNVKSMFGSALTHPVLNVKPAYVNQDLFNVPPYLIGALGGDSRVRCLTVFPLYTVT